jgi:DNA-binding response OmpR family regulator
MSTTTVEMVGVDDLGRIPAFLALGAVVIVAPDRETLLRWQGEFAAATPSSPPPEPVSGLALDLVARRIRWQGEELTLTPMEFRVLATLASQPDRAWSFSELRAAGWEEDVCDGVDTFAVRSVVQRIRRKLRASAVGVRVESVRAFGFRLVADDPVEDRSGLAAVR